MKSVFTILSTGLLCLTTFNLFAQSTDKKEKEEITAIEYRWVKSYPTNDVDYLNSLFSDEAKFISTKGEITTKQSELEELRHKVIKYNLFETTDVNPVFYGSTAVVTSKSHINATVTASGKTVELHVQALDIFIKKNGTWKLVASQLTKLPE